MSTEVIAAIIVGVATIIGAIVGALLARTDFLDKLLRGSKYLSLVGKWKSTWEDWGDHSKIQHGELLIIKHQKGSRIYGYITMEELPDKRWEFEGNFSGRFLQLVYYPSKDSEDKLFLDYGCYFFEMQGDGTFKGYSIGFDYEENRAGISTHCLKRIK